MSATTATRSLNVILSANSASLRSQMALAGREVNRFANDVDHTSKSVVGKAALMKGAFIGVGIAVAAGLAYSVSQAVQFERQMRNVNSISGLTERQLGSLSQQVVDLSKVVPQSASTLAEGLYDIASSGFQGAEGLEVLEAAAVAASAGLTDTSTSAKVITAALNAYGLEASDAGYVSDVLFQAVNVGVVTFDELAASLGDVVGMAAAAKVPISDVASAIATMTLSGISAAEASTSLNRLIQGLIQPSDELAVLYEKLGYESGSLALEQDGLYKVMTRIFDATGGNIDQMLKLFPEIRAVRGALALGAAAGANYARVQGEIADRQKVTGATQRTFNEQMKATGAQWTLFVNRINAGAIALGTKLLPVLQSAMKWAQAAGERGFKLLAHYGELMQPVWESLVDAGKALAEVLGVVWSTAEPLIKMFAALAVALHVGIWRAQAEVLQWVAEQLAQHPGLVRALTVAMLAYAAANIAARVSNMSLWTNAAEMIGTATTAVRKMVAQLALMVALNGGGLTGLVRTLGQGLKSALTSPLAPMALFAAGVYGISQGLANSRREAVALANDAAKAWDPKTATGYADAIKSVNDTLGETNKKIDGQAGSLLDWGAGILDVVTGGNLLEDTLWDNARAGQALGDKLDQLQQDGGNALIGLNDAFRLTHPSISKMTDELGFADESIVALLRTADNANIDLSKPWQEWSAELAKAHVKATQMTPAQAKLAESMETVADEAASAEDQLKAYKDAIDALVGATLSEFEANTKFGGSLESLGKAIAENGGTLDTMSEKGRANREALAGSARAAIEHAQAIAQQTGSIEQGNNTLAFHRQQLINTMMQFGLNELAATAYANQLGLTPENLETLIALNGSEPSLEKLKQLYTQAQQLKEPIFINVVAGRYVVDFDKELEGIQTKAKDVFGTPYLVTIQSNVHDIDRELEGFQTTIPGADGNPITITIDADAVDADTKLRGIQERTTDINGNPVVVTTSIPGVYDVNSQLEGLQFWIRDINGRPVTVTLTESGWADVDPKLKGVQVKAKDINGKTVKFDLAAEDGTDGPVGRVKEKKKDLGKKVKVPIEVEGDSKAKRELQGVKEKANEVDRLSPTVDVKVRYTQEGKPPADVPQLRGGVLKFFAQGGFHENHVAQFAPAGAMRVWAEPETGGEAYIPLGAAKRERSTDILSQVATQFGYSLVDRNRAMSVAPVVRGGDTITVEGSTITVAGDSGRAVDELQRAMDERDRKLRQILRAKRG